MEFAGIPLAEALWMETDEWYLVADPRRLSALKWPVHDPPLSRCPCCGSRSPDWSNLVFMKGRQVGVSTLMCGLVKECDHPWHEAVLHERPVISAADGS